MMLSNQNKSQINALECGLMEPTSFVELRFSWGLVYLRNAILEISLGSLVETVILRTM
jgi:hypothetical protein